MVHDAEFRWDRKSTDIFRCPGLIGLRIRREKVDALRRIDAVIGELPDDRLALLLTLRYRDMRSWDEVAEAMGYTPRQTLRLHRDALDAAKNAIENETCHTMSHTTVIS